MGFRFIVRDQEVEGSNPFAPTIYLATYKMRKSIERLGFSVADREASEYMFRAAGQKK